MVMHAYFAYIAEAYSESFYPNVVQPLCPGEVAVYTCDVPPYSLATSWVLSPSPCNGKSFELTLDPAKCAGIRETCEGFVIQNGMVPRGVCATSTLTVTANKMMNGVHVQCLAKGQFASQLIGEVTLKLVHSPLVTVSVFVNTDEIFVGLNASSEASMTANVSLLDVSNNLISTFTFNGTSENVTFHGLQSDTSYFVTVTTSNCAGITEVTHSAHTCGYLHVASYVHFPLSLSLFSTVAKPPTVTNTALVIEKSYNGTSRYLEVEWMRDRVS